LLTSVCAFVVCLAFWFISSAIRSFYANQSDAEFQAEHERQ
jgi:nitrate/nitrite transporter NarK